MHIILCLPIGTHTYTYTHTHTQAEGSLECEAERRFYPLNGSASDLWFCIGFFHFYNSHDNTC